MNNSWEIIDTGPNNACVNMAIDEALLDLLKPYDKPIFRFYDWNKPAISIGYSQRKEDLLNLKKCEEDGIEIVRRPTGGGVVFHGTDITYSVLFPEKSIKNINDTYLSVQRKIINALEKLGIKITQYTQKSSVRGYCLTMPNIGDIMVDNKKLSGLAIRRINQKVLCQGYIYYDDASEMTKYVKDSSMKDSIKEKSFYIKSKYNITRNEIQNAIIARGRGGVFPPE